MAILPAAKRVSSCNCGCSKIFGSVFRSAGGTITGERDPSSFLILAGTANWRGPTAAKANRHHRGTETRRRQRKIENTEVGEITEKFNTGQRRASGAVGAEYPTETASVRNAVCQKRRKRYSQASYDFPESLPGKPSMAAPPHSAQSPCSRSCVLFSVALW